MDSHQSLDDSFKSAASIGKHIQSKYMYGIFNSVQKHVLVNALTLKHISVEFRENFMDWHNNTTWINLTI